MSYTLITGPASEPVTEALLREHATLDDAVPGSLLAVYIAAARSSAEHLTGRALLPQTWEATLDAFPTGAIRLARAPIIGVSSVTYYDGDGVLSTLDAGNYVLDARTLPGYVALASDASWPDTEDRVNAVIVTYTAGYSSESAIPADIRNWILIRAATAVDNRESVDRSGRLSSLQFVDTLLAPWVTPDGAMWGV